MRSETSKLGYTFKTLYFPRERTHAGKAIRVTISLPGDADDASLSKRFLSYARALHSREFRLAIGDPYLEELENCATEERRSFSNFCLRLLMRHYREQRPRDGPGTNIAHQLALPLTRHQLQSAAGPRQSHRDLGVTFQESRHQPVHSWYPYIQGFSATYVRDVLLRNGSPPSSVYDPFGGAGTTQLAASCLGVKSFYSEVNPFMVFVAETKVRAASWAHRNMKSFRAIADEYLSYLTPERLDELSADVDLSGYEEAFPGRQFFELRHLKHLLGARDLAHQVAAESRQARSLLLLACAANAVHASNMTRRADLRRRRQDEYKTRVVNVAALVAESVRRMVDDTEHLPQRMARTVKVSADCRRVPADFSNSFEMAITSPPYLNGTNYFRNTKIEMWLLGFIKSETELRKYRNEAVTAGINNVARAGGSAYREFESVEAVGRELDECARDRRIPLLVRQYFSDMADVMASVHRSLVPGGRFVMDVGDSRFYGVHVPTDRLLAEVAHAAEFVVENRHVLARRHSRDKSPLVQVELVLRKPKG